MVRVLVLALVVGLALPAGAEGLSDEDLLRKNEGGYVTALPLLAYSADFGVGGGVRGYYYWNGKRSDPRFAVTPYLARVFVNVFATTNGVQYHWLDLDAPRVFSSPYRVRAQLVLARNRFSNYFGFHEAGRAALRFPGASQRFERYSDYDAAQRRIVGGETYTRYDQYDQLRPTAITSIERALLGDRLRVLGGVRVSYLRIRDYTGRTVDATADDGAESSAPQAPTRLREDCDAGLLVGCSGGRDHTFRVGLVYDTRDFEPDPNRGVYADLSIDVGTIAVGSQFDYVRALLAVRGYWSPMPEIADLVLAGRAMVQAQTAGTPFFSMDVLPFVEDPRTGLGGHRTLRGFRQSRYVDHAMSAVSGEVRWTFARTTIRCQKLAFIVAPFVDLGRAADDLAGLAHVSRWRPSAGAAFRVSWNLATIGTLDYGFSEEGSGLYVNFGHMF
ncbi:MAG: BamA/TamA family outer membrane protein [Deltaproteobacteria bacterium]|nr:BamA/TamA family outer membrane protein [Deltaproteobacteria bacterium]